MRPPPAGGPGAARPGRKYLAVTPAGRAALAERSERSERWAAFAATTHGLLTTRKADA
ncbi:hypothetical protein [Jiangella ureilytica]|uniref:hypothetical protein n=1 Tax=Jiangella ureilytica TaxID=2530374 RepID=UPI0013A5EF19|nr:hypothetical protein [Jiangella ureilytica]